MSLSVERGMLSQTAKTSNPAAQNRDNREGESRELKAHARLSAIDLVS
jgi:hypothetical protein